MNVLRVDGESNWILWASNQGNTGVAFLSDSQQLSYYSAQTFQTGKSRWVQIMASSHGRLSKAAKITQGINVAYLHTCMSN